ncbi:MAG: hypothetical protein RIE77_09525 [Phycisphaerales bacterium]|jgi:hypothetical protein
MHRTSTAVAASAALVFSMTAAAVAQTPGTVFIEIDQPVLAPGESTTVRLLAGWGGPDFAMAGVATSLLADAGGRDVAASWSDWALIAPMDGPGTSEGEAIGNGFGGIIAGQLNFPVAGIYSEPDPNPMPFWEVTFTAPTDLGAFEVDLSTDTERFDVYIARFSALSESRLDGLTEGAGTIVVVPAPAGGVVLLGLIALRRRR